MAQNGKLLKIIEYRFQRGAPLKIQCGGKNGQICEGFSPAISLDLKL